MVVQQRSHGSAPPPSLRAASLPFFVAAIASLALFPQDNIVESIIA